EPSRTILLACHGLVTNRRRRYNLSATVRRIRSISAPAELPAPMHVLASAPACLSGCAACWRTPNDENEVVSERADRRNAFGDGRRRDGPGIPGHGEGPGGRF